MTTFSKKHLLYELVDRTELIISNTRPFQRLNNEQLNYKPAAGKWSISEVFEHLNITHHIYLHSILSKISQAPEVKSSMYNSSWLGDLLYTKTMPRPDGTVFKLKTRRLLQPTAREFNGNDVLNRFLQHQDSIHDVLLHASTKDLRCIKIPFSFTNVLKWRLGDNLRFLIAHNERHMLQAQRVLEKIPAREFLFYDNSAQVV
jgi:uncharacterized damage-inducible protein DinB